MFNSFLISFREFLEIFIIIGIFLGLSEKLHLHKKKEITLAAFLGIAFNLVFTVCLLVFKEKIKLSINGEVEELIEGVTMIFSGIFVLVVVLAFHRFIIKHKFNEKTPVQFFSVFLLVIFEGLEIALFTAGASFSTNFIEHFLGLLLGFITAGAIGLMSFFIYIKINLYKIVKLTEVILLIVGLSMVVNGFKVFISFF